MQKGDCQLIGNINWESFAYQKYQNVHSIDIFGILFETDFVSWFFDLNCLFWWVFLFKCGYVITLEWKQLLKSKYGCLFFDCWNMVFWVVFGEKLFDK